MNVTHFEKGFQYSSDQLLLVARKIGKLATYCGRIKDEASQIRVESERRDAKKERDQVKVMITIELPKKVLRAESRRPDPIEAVDRCIEKLEPQVKKYKELHSGAGKRRRRSRE
jgi:ribosomal subunit interface protein